LKIAFERAADEKTRRRKPTLEKGFDEGKSLLARGDSSSQANVGSITSIIIDYRIGTEAVPTTRV